MSPNLLKRDGDGALILEFIREAAAPLWREARSAKACAKAALFKVEFRRGKTAVPTVVSVTRAGR